MIFGLGELLFELRDHAIAQLPGPAQIALALGLVKLGAGLVEAFLNVARCFQFVALGLPFGGHLGGLLLQITEFLFELGQAILGGRVVFLLERFGFDLHLQDLPVERVEFFGFAVDFHAQTARGFVHQVDGFVGQEAVGDVAVGQRGSTDQSAVGDPHTVVQFILFLDAAQDRDRVFDRRFFDQKRLEPAGEGRVFFDVFAVFVERGGANAVQFAAREGGLDEVGGIHRTVGFTRADEDVHFVDEKDDFTGGIGDFAQHGLQAFLELTTIFRPRNQRAHVERHQRLVAKALGHVAVDDAQGEAFGNRGFTDAGLPDQDGVVFSAARQNLHGAADFFVAANDRVDLAVARRFGQVAGVFVERIVVVFGRRTVGGLALAQIVDGGVERLRVHGTRIERVFCAGFHHRQRGQHPFDRHECVARFGGDLLGLVEDLGELLVEVDLRAVARDLGQFGDFLVQRFAHPFRRAARAANEVGGKPLLIIKQSFQQMFGNQFLMVFPLCDRLRGLNEPTRAIREFFHVHHVSPLIKRPDGSRPQCGTRPGGPPAINGKPMGHSQDQRRSLAPTPWTARAWTLRAAAGPV